MDSRALIFSLVIAILSSPVVKCRAKLRDQEPTSSLREPLWPSNYDGTDSDKLEFNGIEAKLLDETDDRLGSRINLPNQFEDTNQEADYSVSYTPVILWHGMGDSAHGSINVDRVALERRFPGMRVLSVQIGNSAAEDVLAGYFVNVNHQIQQVCREILANELIREHKAFNAIGFSQGAQFMRGLIQRCPLRENGIRVKNFISLGGQHQGVFGLPNCRASIFCDHIRELLTNAAYQEDVQEHLVQAEYWHDPIHESEYASKNIFLADINNELTINNTYRQNIISLDNLVLVEFTEDEMVVPRESSLFGYYAENDLERIIPLEESKLFIEDRLGLKQLKDGNRLALMKVPGRHLRYNMSWFLDEIASVYLNN